MSGGTPPAAQAATAWMPDFLLLAAVWGASFLFMHVAALEFGALPTAALRVGVAALFLAPILAWRGLWPQVLRHWPRILFVGIFNSGLPFALYCWALTVIPTGLSAILNATVPMFGALVAWAWLRERPSLPRTVGLIVGFAGVAMLAWDKASFSVDPSRADGAVASGWGVVACLLAAVSYAVAASFTKRHLQGVPPIALAAGSQIGATLVLALPALWFAPHAMPGAKAWGAILGVGVLCTGLAYILFFRIIANAGPARALAVTYAVPVFALCYGAVLLSEAVTPWMLVCGGVIVLGTALATGALDRWFAARGQHEA